jgi:hypothetical protein
MQNQILKRSITEMIKTKNPSVNTPNFIAHNETVAIETKRLAGCFFYIGYTSDFLEHGQTSDVVRNNRNEPVCSANQATCNDGELTFSPSSRCQITRSDLECQASGDNNGCRKIISSSAGQKFIGATAVCNLEYGVVSDRELATARVNYITVIRQSDHVSEGLCTVGSTSLRSGQKLITEIAGLNQIAISCKEHDENGGDCHVRAVLYSR